MADADDTMTKKSRLDGRYSCRFQEPWTLGARAVIVSKTPS